MNRSSPSEMFLGKGVLKICRKFTGEHPCRSAISIKLLYNCYTYFKTFRNGQITYDIALHSLKRDFVDAIIIESYLALKGLWETEALIPVTALVIPFVGFSNYAP